MFNCEQVVRMAADFIDRKVRLRERAMILIHIAMCGGCRAYVDQFRLTLLALRSLPAPARAPVPHDLMVRFRDRAHPRR
jgi:predicted anti-sigma-YlaC factor YlaD